MKTPDYEAIALKIVPPSSHRTVGQLRSLIASTLEKEIQVALTRQREEGFPDIVELRKGVENHRKDLDQWEETTKREHKKKESELRSREDALAQKELQFKWQEESLVILLQAFDRYIAWLEGDGEIDENGKRFTALRNAYQTYKDLKARRDKK